MLQGITLQDPRVITAKIMHVVGVDDIGSDGLEELLVLSLDILFQPFQPPLEKPVEVEKWRPEYLYLLELMALDLDEGDG